MANLIELEVNGKRSLVKYPPDASLLTVLRDELGLTGAKYGCGEGQCGACTVLIGGAPRRSCQVPVSAGVGKSITTIEGLEKEGLLHPVQQAFLDAGAFQCAFCTPGMIISKRRAPALETQSHILRNYSIPAREYLPLRDASAHHQRGSSKPQKRCKGVGHERTRAKNLSLTGAIRIPRDPHSSLRIGSPRFFSSSSARA